MEHNRNEIGGYFELEFNNSGEFHYDAIKLNTSRNALEYILLANQYEKIYLPYFTCEVILEPIKKYKIDFEFYFIDEKLEPIFDYTKIKEKETFLYTNYFGIKDSFINQFTCKNLLLDCAQSFFYKPSNNVDAIYSPRKFFGVPDGGYLYSNSKLNKILEVDISYERMTHLLKRIDLGAEEGYNNFIENEKSLHFQPIKQMSILTQSILTNIPYKDIGIKRKDNFHYLHERLCNLNRFKINLNEFNVPMLYPFWIKGGEELRNKLLGHKVYTPKYWPNVLENTNETMLENRWVTEVVYLPVDQRYSIHDMDRIVNIIKRYIN